MLVFEDAHDLRPPMLDLIEAVGGRRARSRRRRSRSHWVAPSWSRSARTGAGRPTPVTLRLDPLPGQDAVELVRRRPGDGSPIPRPWRSPTAPGEPVLHRRDHGDGATRPLGRRGGLRPDDAADRPGRGGGAPGQPPAPASDLARRASVFLYSFDRDELATVSDAEPEDLRGLEDAEILVREDGARAKWRFRHETVREVAYASLPKRERPNAPRGDRGRPDGVGASLVRGRSPGASGTRVAGPRPVRSAARSCRRRTDPGRRPCEATAREPVRRRLLRARCGWRARRRRGGSARRGPSPARARPTTGWASTRRPASRARDGARREVRRPVDPRARARYQGDIAINVDGDLERAEQLLADSLAAAGELDDAWAMSRSLLFAGWVPWTRGIATPRGRSGSGP